MSNIKVCNSIRNVDGLQLVVEFDNGNGYSLFQDFNGMTLGGRLPTTIVKKLGTGKEAIDYTLELNTRKLNDCLDFLRAVENKKLCWVSCVKEYCIDIDPILNILY